MDINDMINNLNWKKIAIVIAGIMAVFWVSREIVFWEFFHAFNKQFNEAQNAIEKKIAESEQASDKFKKKMDQNADDLSEFVHKQQQQTSDFFKQSEHEMAERDKAMTQAFQDAPKEMRAQQEQFGKEMQKHFWEENEKMDDDFKKHVMNVDKTIAARRCYIRIPPNPDLFVPYGLTQEQIKERHDFLTKERIKVANKEHCEAYL